MDSVAEPWKNETYAELQVVATSHPRWGKVIKKSYTKNGRAKLQL